MFIWVEFMVLVTLMLAFHMLLLLLLKILHSLVQYLVMLKLSFYLAEAAARGFTDGIAKDHYEAGIKASMNYWNQLKDNTPMGWDRIDNGNTNVLPASITGAEMDAYIASAEVAWDAAKSSTTNCRAKIYCSLPFWITSMV